MASVIERPISEPKGVRESEEILMHTLDELLERYLNLLDKYQSLQQEFSKQLSAGFLELAKANFLNPNRIRYGQDFYDERMQATTQIDIATSDPLFSINTSAVQPVEEEKSRDEPTSLPESLSTDVPPESEKTTNGAQKLHDPLKWFGVLVPPALRSSQTKFKSAVIDAMPALVNVDTEMKEVEIEIRRTRKKLGKLR